MASLCAHADVTLLTATQDDAPMGTLVELARNGSMVDCSKKLARQRGTTVSVNGLFHGLPVRRREFERNAKREYGKAQALLQAYALISKGVRWSSSNTTGSSGAGGGSGPSSSAGNPAPSRKTVALTISSASSQDYLMRNFASLFGSKAPAAVQDLKLDLEFERGRPKRRLLQQPGSSRAAAASKRLRQAGNGDADDESGAASDEDAANSDEEDGDATDVVDTSNRHHVAVRGLISRPTRGSGRTSTDRQFLYINGRPWENVKVTRAFNEVYRHFNTNQVPIVVADFLLPTESYDVNVSPDKRTIFLHDEAQLVEALKTALEELFAPARSTLAVNQAVGASMTQQRLALSASQAATPAPRATSSRSRIEDQESEDEEMEESAAPAADDDQDQDGQEPTSAQQQSASRSDQIDDSDEEEQPAQPPAAPNALARLMSASATRNSSAAPRPPSSSLAAYKSNSAPIRPWTNNRGPPMTSMPAFAAQSSSKPSVTLTQMLARHKAPQAKPSTEAVGNDEQQEVAQAADDDEAGEGEEDASEPTLKASEDLEYRESPGEAPGQDKENQQAAAQAPGSDPVPQECDDDREDAEQLRLAKHVSRDGDEADEDDDDRRRNLAGLDEDDDIPDPNSTIAQQATRASSSQQPPPPSQIIAGGSTFIDVAALSDRLASLRVRKMQAASNGDAEDAGALDSSAAGIDNPNAAEVESRLERVISKDDFAEMEILGQFNLGFIIARRRRTAADPTTSSGVDDLFIIDQHASDEKFNFETLQSQTKIRSQRLIQPRALELSATDELVAAQHLDALATNGFEVQIDEDAPAGSRCSLVSQPVSKDIVFGTRDLEELLYQLRDVTPGSAKAMGVRCSKARAMFASRACRKSVMIGMALNKRQMQTVVRHMGTIEQPWNCPHGRPTMRHLACLREMAEGAERVGGVMWGNAAAL